MPIERSAGGIVFRKTNGDIQYLLLHYPKGSRTKKDYWDFPKGHVEKGEKLIETAKREINEETGLNDIKIIDGFKETIKYYFYSQGKRVLKFVTFFLVSTNQEEITISKEHIGFTWAPFKEAIKILTYDNAKSVLKKANDFLINKIKENSLKNKVSFKEKVYNLVKKIPKGKFLTYKEVAILAERPTAWRAVGNILNKTKKENIRIPCHRVIRSDRKVGGYNRGEKKKIFLLKKEGIKIKKKKVIF
ncbi:MAG: methylated-DNA--[protein]-cysteine S-methyltransferase [Minisyncoccia bacterium]